jgi:hypothetical protein
MSYFHEHIVDIIRKVKSPHHAADEIIQMLEDEGILDSDDEEEDEEEDEEQYEGSKEHFNDIANGRD